MKQHISALLGILMMSILNASHAETVSGNAEATASVGGNCLIEVDDLAFGDVTFQTMNGSGDVSATTDLRMLCTKNAAVTLTSKGHGTGLEAYQTYTLEVDPSVEYHGDIVTRTYDTNGTLVSQDITNNYVYPENQLQDGFNGSHDYITSNAEGYATQTYEVDTNNNRFIHTATNADGSSVVVEVQAYAVAAGATTPLANQSDYFTYVALPGVYTSYGIAVPAVAMSNGADEIGYELSTTSDFQEILGSVESNTLTYAQNDGQFQTFPLYGRANVLHAKPGVYADTNFVTIHF